MTLQQDPCDECGEIIPVAGLAVAALLVDRPSPIAAYITVALASYPVLLVAMAAARRKVGLGDDPATTSVPPS